MNLADVFTFLFVILGFVIAFISYWLLAAGLFPAFVQRSAERFGRMPVRALLLGLVTLAPLIALGVRLSIKASTGGGKVLALSLVVVPLLAALFGSAGWAMRVGTGLKSMRDETDPWRRMLRGSVVLGLAFVLPVIGTFLVLPAVFISGFGAFLLGLRRPQPPVALAMAPAHELSSAA